MVPRRSGKYAIKKINIGHRTPMDIDGNILGELLAEGIGGTVVPLVAAFSRSDCLIVRTNGSMWLYNDVAAVSNAGDLHE